MIYCDMDGVICDFNTGFEEKFGIHPQSVSFWKRWYLVHSMPDYWTTLPKMKNADILMSYLKNFDFSILTAAPIIGHYAASSGKKEWLKEHFDITSNVICCLKQNKRNYCKKGDILIDDLEDNIKSWEDAGGIGILHTSVESTIARLMEMGYVKKQNKLPSSNTFSDYLDTLVCQPAQHFSEEEVIQIHETEHEAMWQNYDIEMSKLSEKIIDSEGEPSLAIPKLSILLGYPGCGKTTILNSTTDIQKPYHYLDLDDFRTVFPNLFQHLKDGHIDEYYKFSCVANDCFNNMLHKLLTGSTSIFLVGATGLMQRANSYTQKALNRGFETAITYIAIPPQIAMVRALYRYQEAYHQIIHNNEEIVPRLPKEALYQSLENNRINFVSEYMELMQQNPDKLRLKIVNRDNKTIYDSNRSTLSPQKINRIIQIEEIRSLSRKDKLSLSEQLSFIYKMIKYRYDNNIYPPTQEEIDLTKNILKQLNDLSLPQTNNDLLLTSIALKRKQKSR